MTPEQLTQAFGEIVKSYPSQAILLLAGANFAMGVTNALKDRKLSGKEIANIFRKLYPYLAYLGLGTGASGISNETAESVEWGGGAILFLKFAYDAFKNLIGLTSWGPLKNLVPTVLGFLKH